MKIKYIVTAILVFISFSFTDRECGFKDGQYEASVKYYNYNTGKQSDYTLKVDVEDCEVTVIYFPKGGWLDGSHIRAAALDDDGDATAYDDHDREFKVHIDKEDEDE